MKNLPTHLLRKPSVLSVKMVRDRLAKVDKYFTISDLCQANNITPTIGYSTIYAGKKYRFLESEQQPSESRQRLYVKR